MKDRLKKIMPKRIILPIAVAALTNASLPVPGQSFPGYALQFNGANQHVAIPGFFTNAPTTEVTVEFWQNVSAVQAQSSFSQDDSERGGFDASNAFNAHVPYSDGNVYWDFGDINGQGRLSYTPPVSLAGTWQHFALEASQSGNFMRIYRNGVLEAQKTGMTLFAGGAFDLDIAGESNATYNVSFGGTLDEFRIWNVARSQSDIQANMYRSLSLPQPNLVAYWRFDEGSGGVLHDASDNGRDGLLVNGPAWVASGVPTPPAPPNPKLTIAPDAYGGYFISAQAQPDFTCKLQRATNTTGPWSTSASQTSDASGLIQFHDQFPPPRQAFYRTVQP